MTAANPSKIRTRFAPSPTGYLHVGGARTALYSWAYARRHQGVFVLRIEDTDLERSTPEAVQAILDGMQWLGLDHDEGPFYQMKRMERYREVIAAMVEAGTAYHCYSSREELDAMRERAMAAGQKPRYDGTWRPEPGKALPPVPAGVQPVVRFRNPVDGEVSWNDVVKGTITISNKELDDLIIARPDGTPTYNFCVVVDDWDMGITHVIRGDDHVNNTPRQINILAALGATLPLYGHLPMILDGEGKKLSKRTGAASVTEFEDMGYLPETMLNYLARLGWAHGDDEVFSVEQFCAWFDLDHLTSSAARFDMEKLNWLNNHYIKGAELARLEALVKPRLDALGAQFDGAPALQTAIAMLRERAHTTRELAEAAIIFYRQPEPAADLLAQHMTNAIKPALAQFAEVCNSVEWNKAALSAALKEVLVAHKLKMPQLAMPLRLALTGQLQTPAIDAVIELFGRETARARLAKYIG